MLFSRHAMAAITLPRDDMLLRCCYARQRDAAPMLLCVRARDTRESMLTHAARCRRCYAITAVLRLRCYAQRMLLLRQHAIVVFYTAATI